MKIIPPRFELGRDEVRKPVITIGNFDGLHRGHRELIRKVIARARKIGGQGALITFIPHPIRVLHPDANLEILTTLEQKIVLLEDQGIDLLILLEFTPEFSRMSAEKFVREYLV
jgi:riboflavin kinase/FMN adenylyltransferase